MSGPQKVPSKPAAKTPQIPPKDRGMVARLAMTKAVKTKRNDGQSCVFKTFFNEYHLSGQACKVLKKIDKQYESNLKRYNWAAYQEMLKFQKKSTQSAPSGSGPQVSCSFSVSGTGIPSVDITSNNTAACKHLDKAGQIKSEREAVLAEIYSRKLKTIKRLLNQQGQSVEFMDKSFFDTTSLDSKWMSHPYFKSNVRLVKP